MHPFIVRNTRGVNMLLKIDATSKYKKAHIPLARILNGENLIDYSS
jgi:hypothetical protein